jgi:hypothetical protein
MLNKYKELEAKLAAKEATKRALKRALNKTGDKSDDIGNLIQEHGPFWRPWLVQTNWLKSINNINHNNKKTKIII